MILGWDIGGAAIKVAAVCHSGGTRGSCDRAVTVPCNIRDDPSILRAALEDAIGRLRVDPHRCDHAVTMTAELARAFRTKGDGVTYVLDTLQQLTADASVAVYTTGGWFVTPEKARSVPLLVAAANWMATARFVARSVPTCLLIDIGSTSTDLIPLVDGHVRADGRTDPERLRRGELVYTGALRTPVEALVRRVPLWGDFARVASEAFAVTADVHLWRGRLTANDIGALVSGGRPRNRADAGDRLARVVCADREMLDDDAVDLIADAIADAQIADVAEAIREVSHRHAVSEAVVTGVGDFIAVDACRQVGLTVTHLAEQLGPAAVMAPAVAVAVLRLESQCPTS